MRKAPDYVSGAFLRGKVYLILFGHKVKGRRDGNDGTGKTAAQTGNGTADAGAANDAWKRKTEGRSAGLSALCSVGFGRGMPADLPISDRNIRNGLRQGKAGHRLSGFGGGSGCLEGTGGGTFKRGRGKSACL